MSELDTIIKFHQDVLVLQGFALEPSVKYLEELTVKYLEKLKSIIGG